MIHGRSTQPRETGVTVPEAEPCQTWGNRESRFDLWNRDSRFARLSAASVTQISRKSLRSRKFEVPVRCQTWGNRESRFGLRNRDSRFARLSAASVNQISRKSPRSKKFEVPVRCQTWGNRESRFGLWNRDSRFARLSAGSVTQISRKSPRRTPPPKQRKSHSDPMAARIPLELPLGSQISHPCPVSRSGPTRCGMLCKNRQGRPRPAG